MKDCIVPVPPETACQSAGEDEFRIPQEKLHLLNSVIRRKTRRVACGVTFAILEYNQINVNYNCVLNDGRVSNLFQKVEGERSKSQKRILKRYIF